MERQSTAHHDVVVETRLGAIAAAGLLLVHAELVAGHAVVFYIAAVAHQLYHSRYEHRLGGAVGVEAHAAAERAADAVEALAAVHIGVLVGEARQYEQPLRA